jgi:hypothetical protein
LNSNGIPRFLDFFSRLNAQGERLTPSHAVKKGRRYRYYVSAALITDAGADRAQGWRLAAREIEEAVIRILADALTSPAGLVASEQSACLEPRRAGRRAQLSSQRSSNRCPL